MLAKEPYDPDFALASQAAKALLAFDLRGDLFSGCTFDLRLSYLTLRRAGATECAALVAFEVGDTVVERQAFYAAGLAGRLQRFKFAKRWAEYVNARSARITQ
jgi:hypothetical protein